MLLLRFFFFRGIYMFRYCRGWRTRYLFPWSKIHAINLKGIQGIWLKILSIEINLRLPVIGVRCRLSWYLQFPWKLLLSMFLHGQLRRRNTSRFLKWGPPTCRWKWISRMSCRIKLVRETLPLLLLGIMPLEWRLEWWLDLSHKGPTCRVIILASKVSIVRLRVLRLLIRSKRWFSLVHKE